MDSSTQLLLFVGLLLQAALVGAVGWRRLWRKFPAFSSYAICNFIENVGAYLSQGHTTRFFYVYSIGESVTIVLGIAAVYELFVELLARHQALRNIAAWILRACAVLLCLLAGAVLFAHGPVGRTSVAFAIMRVEEAARIIELGFLVFLFIFSGVFGLHWRQWTFGIALGLGVLVAVKLLVITMVPYSTPALMKFWFTFSAAVFDACVLTWFGYLVFPEHSPETSELPQHSQLEQWNRAILELIHPGPLL